jgi:hypothetical protein
MGLSEWVAAGTVHSFQGSEGELVIYDSVLDEPYWSSRLTNPKNVDDVVRDLNVAVTRAKHKFVFVGSSQWFNDRAHVASGMGRLWSFLKDRADLVSALEFLNTDTNTSFQQVQAGVDGWSVPRDGENPRHEILDETTFFDRFTSDVNAAKESFFGLAPYFGDYRWPRIQPLLAAALRRGVEVTLVTPPAKEASNRSYVLRAVKNLRELGAVVIASSGLHGKDVVIDGKIHYTGSLNWSSHRGRIEIMHRTEGAAFANSILEYLQARHIRNAAVYRDGSARTCPECGKAVHVVNQRKQSWHWDKQALKLACSNKDCQKYLRPIDERPPIQDAPTCSVDGKTRYRRVKRGRGEIWQCPKHPRQCPTEKVVPGDPER